MATVGDLPSGEHAAELIRAPSSAAVVNVAGDFLGRAALVGVGLYLAGGKRPHLVRDALFASAAIEVFVLGFTASTAAKK